MDKLDKWKSDRADSYAERGSQKTMKKKLNKPIRETEDGFFYPKYTNKYYVVRRWDDGEKKQFAHYFPTANGKLPRGFRTKKSADSHIAKWQQDKYHGAKVVTQKQAKQYIVPKRG